MTKSKSRGSRSNARKTSRGQGAVATPRPAPALPGWLMPAVIFLATGVAFFPALQNEFVDWDDYKTLVENNNYRGLGWTQLRWMFTTFHMGHYQPLTWMSFALDYLVWGVDPFGYHLTNLFLHAVNGVLFYFVTLRLLVVGQSSRAFLGEAFLPVAAAFGALLFAVHPLRVESVAWATERRDVLSGLFFLLTISCYLKSSTARESDAAQRHGLMTGALISYLLSLLAKATSITLPLVILILDVYPLARLGGGPGKWFGPQARKVWWEKAPFILLALAFGIIALFAQREVGALKPVERYDLLSRLAQALFGITFYLWKSALPLGLSPLYELPVQLNPWDWPFLLSGLVVLAISVWLYLARRAWPAGIATWLYYVVVLSPVLGIAQSGPQIAADRYSYLSCLGWSVLAGAGLRYCWGTGIDGKFKERKLIFSSALAGLVVLGLGALAWRQTHVWHDTESLWRHALAVGQGSSTVHYNLAYVLHKRGERAEAIEHYRKSLSFNHVSADAHYYLADALAEQGRLEEAIEHYSQALKIKPHFWGAHNNLAIVLERQGRVGEAIRHYRQVLRINPANGEAHASLAIALLRRGEFDEAVEHFRDSLRLDPSQSAVYFSLGTTLAMRGRLDEAVVNLRQAVQINPSFAAAYHNLGRVLAAQGQLDKAIDSLQSALEIEPESAEIHASLSQALAERGNKDEAMRHHREALRLMKSQQGASGLR